MDQHSNSFDDPLLDDCPSSFAAAGKASAAGNASTDAADDMPNAYLAPASAVAARMVC